MVSVAVPGPPWNSAQVFGNSAIASRKRSTSARKITGRSSGSCTSQKTRQRDAPRICAASIGSLGMEDRPASMMMNENGVQFQISSSVTAASAMSASESHATLNCVPEIWLMMSLIGPLWYNIISAVYATTIGTVSIGRMKTT